MIRQKHKRRRVPELNTTSTADISFMLLTFFLVTTSVDIDSGLSAQLPPRQQQEQAKDSPVERRNVVFVEIGANDSIAINGEAVDIGAVTGRLCDIIDNSNNSPQLPEKHVVDVPLIGRRAVADAHVILLRADRNASYAAYFATQQAIAQAYGDLRDRLARTAFGHNYAECSDEQRQAVAQCYPKRISEAPASQEGGAR